MIAMQGFTRGVAYPVPVRIPIKTLNIHRAPHLDEIATAVLVAAYGEAYFPGVRTALAEGKIDFTEREWSREEYIKFETLPIGTGYGTWFNEHIRGGDRMKGQCAFTLAVRYLHLGEMPALRRLTQEVYESDTEAKCTPTMLAELVKTDHRHQIEYVHTVTKQVVRPGERLHVFAWATPFILAIIDRQAQIIRGEALGHRHGEKTLRDYFHRWLRDQEKCLAETGDVMDPRVKSSLSKQISDSMRNKATKVTELAHIVEALTRTGKSETFIVDRLEYVFNAMLISQTDFWAEYDRQELEEADKGPPALTDALFDDRPAKLYISVVVSSSPQAAKVARFRRNRIQDEMGVAKADRIPGLTLLRAPDKGNMQIFTDRELAGVRVRAGSESCVGVLEIAIRMIRTLELLFQGADPRDVQIKTFTALGMEGEGPDKIWYYFKNGGMAMNGSTTKDRPPTKILPTQMLTILQHAFHPDLFQIWVDKQLPRYLPNK
ncbi:MAG TPA: hypothetical protein VF438_02835 [Candidatus Paceibacterota bacterium]